jgi:hypothetical protein
MTIARADIAPRPTGSPERPAARPVSRVRHAASLAALAIALAGCGSTGAASPSATRSSATRTSAGAAFVAAASAICVNTDIQLGALATPGVATPSGDHATLVKLVAAEFPIDEAELRKLAAVRAPAGQRRAYAVALSDARDDVALLPKILVALRGSHKAALAAVTQESAAISDVAVAAMKTLNLPQCSRNL